MIQGRRTAPVLSPYLTVDSEPQSGPKAVLRISPLENGQPGPPASFPGPRAKQCDSVAPSEMGGLPRVFLVLERNWG